MAEIIDFRKKAPDESRLRQMKIESLRRHFQCMRCAFRCARCGSQINNETRSAGGEQYAAPYIFCKTCYEEYKEYRKIKSGEKPNPDYYWHNDLWVQVWDFWLKYQESMERYRQSPEFLRLMDEVEKFMRRK